MWEFKGDTGQFFSFWVKKCIRFIKTMDRQTEASRDSDESSDPLGRVGAPSYRSQRRNVSQHESAARLKM